MIKIDLCSAMAFYLFSFLFLVLGLWIFYNYPRKVKRAPDSKFAEQCPYCTYLFFDFHTAQVKICPRCKSYITRQENLGLAIGE